MPVFHGCAAGPCHSAPTGPGPAPPPGGLGSSCAQSQPAAPRKLHDVTQPDRRKEQAPRSYKRQEKSPSWPPRNHRDGQHRESLARDRLSPPLRDKSLIICRKQRAGACPVSGADLAGGARDPATPWHVASWSQPSRQPRWKLPDESVRGKRAGVCS